MRIEILVDALPVRRAARLGIAVSLIAIVHLRWCWPGAPVSLPIEYYQNADVMMPRIWRIPRIWPYVIVPVGSGMLGPVPRAVRLAALPDPLVAADPKRELKAQQPLRARNAGRPSDSIGGMMER